MYCCSMGHCYAIDFGDFKSFSWSARQVDRFLGLCDTFKQQRKFLGIKRISDSLTKFTAVSKFIVSKCG